MSILNMNENGVVLLNMLLYIGLTVFYLYKYKWHNIATIVGALYAIGATCSYLLYNFPLYYLTFTSNGNCTLEACLYLFAVNYLLISSLRHFSIDETQVLTHYNEHCFDNILKTLSVLFIIYLAFNLPISISYFFSGSDLAELRDDSYGVDNSSNFFLVRLITRLFNSSSILLLILPCIRLVLLKTAKKIDKVALAVYMLLKVNTMFAVVSRAIVVFSFLELIIVFGLFHSYFSADIKKKVAKFCIVIIPGIFIVFNSISYARFGTQGVMDKQLSTLRYSGEANLNFMGLMYPDLKKPFHGYSMFPFYRRVLGLKYNDGSSREGSTTYDTYIAKEYNYPHPVYVFYGLAGTLYSNWGWIGAILIALIINILLTRNRSSYEISAMSLIIAIILASYIGKGIFYADYQGDSGNLMIIYLLILYRYLKSNGYSMTIYK